jgi:hypothetical protein
VCVFFYFYNVGDEYVGHSHRHRVFADGWQIMEYPSASLAVVVIYLIQYFETIEHCIKISRFRSNLIKNTVQKVQKCSSRHSQKLQHKAYKPSRPEKRPPSWISIQYSRLRWIIPICVVEPNYAKYWICSSSIHRK